MMTVFINEADMRRDVAFASPFPGRIQPVNVLDWGGTIIAQRDSFLCGARGLDVRVALQRNIGAGFFGGEGLFYVRLRGPGRIVLQTLPFSRLADRIIAAAPAGRTGGGAKGTIGSLGAIFGDE